jgi:hypothetical protein
MVDTETGEFTEKTLSHQGNAIRAFYANLEGPVVVGIEATGAMQWFLELLDELGIEGRVDIRRRSQRKKRGSRSMIGGTHACCCSCSVRILSGDLDALDRTA